MEGAWLHLWKEKLIRYWVDQNLHFGVLVTSPIEGCHSTLKSYLQRGSGDLNSVFNKLVVFQDAQRAGILEALAKEKLRLKHNTNTPLFAALIGRVHDYALQKLVVEQSKIPREGYPIPFECTCQAQETIGLPCSHIIYMRKQAGNAIRLEDIHLYWYYDYIISNQDLDQNQVLQPLVIRGKGRPKGALGLGGSHKSKGVHDTRRLPSAFELPSSSAPAAIETQPTRREKLYIV